MADFYKRITDMQGTVEDLVRRAPGFKGYFEKQDRRAADKLLREKLGREYGNQLDAFARVQRKIVVAGGMRYMQQAQSIQTRLQTLIDKIESASEGYAGLFDAVKVDERSLASVYAFDNSMFVYQDQLATGLKELDKVVEGGEVGPVLDQLDALVSEMASAFSRRVEALQGLQSAV